MVINEEEKNAFTQSVMGDTEGGGSSVSFCEANVDFNTGRIEFLEKASVLYEQKKSGILIIHFKMTTGTAYQELYFDVFACRNSVNGATNAYSFYVNFIEAGTVTLDAGNGDNHPVGYINFDAN